MKIMELIADAWNRAKEDVARPMECPFDYFGEGYLAAHLMQNVEVKRLTAELATCREGVIEECAKVSEKEQIEQPPNVSVTSRDAHYNHACKDCATAIRALKGQK